MTANAPITPLGPAATGAARRTAAEVTSSYYQANVGVRVFRTGLRALQALWPSMAVRAAYRLFGTPLPPRFLQRRGDWARDWNVEQWGFEDANLTVYAKPVAPHGPVALLVHGWGGHAAQMLPLADTLAQRGLRPVLLEMPAHGRSDGSVSNLPQFARAIEYAVARLTQQGHEVRVLAAHSLSANAAAFAAARALPVQRLVLIAPPASPRNYTKYFAQVFGLTEATRACMQRLVEAREGILMRQLEPDAVGPRIRIPTLVVHDREDSINRFADGQAYAHEIRGAELVATEGLGHRKILKDASVLGRVALFSQ